LYMGQKKIPAYTGQLLAQNYEQSLIALRPAYTMQRGLLIRVL